MQSLIKTGVPFPPWERRPQVPLRLAWVMEAFHELGTCRPIGMSVGAIPWTAIDQYAANEGIADRERFRILIRTLDATFLDSIHKPKDERRGKKKEKGDA